MSLTPVGYEISAACVFPVASTATTMQARFVLACLNNAQPWNCGRWRADLRQLVGTRGEHVVWKLLPEMGEQRRLVTRKNRSIRGFREQATERGECQCKDRFHAAHSRCGQVEAACIRSQAAPMIAMTRAASVSTISAAAAADMARFQ